MSDTVIILNTPLARRARILLFSCFALMALNVIYLWLLIHNLAPPFPEAVTNYVSELFPVIYRPVNLLNSLIETPEDISAWRREFIKSTMGFNIIFCSITGSIFLGFWIIINKLIYRENIQTQTTFRAQTHTYKAFGYIKTSIILLLASFIILVWMHWYGADQYPESPSYKIGSRTLIMSNYGIYMYAAAFWGLIFFICVALWMITYARLIKYHEKQKG